MTTLLALEEITWHHPSVWLLLMLLALPVLAWWMFRRGARPAVAFSTTETAAQLPRTWRTRLHWAPGVLRLLALAMLIVAVARPQIGNAHTRSYAEGIAIEMLIDRSGSMQAMDFKLDGQPVDRLTAVKNVAAQFVKGDGGKLEGRKDDLVGLIAFGTFADQLSPMTLDHDYLNKQLDKVQVPANQNERETAIGDALGLAAERMDALTRQVGEQTKSELKGKVIILLTDGENTQGQLDPAQAAKIAKALGIRVYTIGVGTTGMAPYPAVDPFGRTVYRMQPVRIDEKTLQEVAQTTGGQYFRATDTASLKQIYEAIDKLEKTKVEEQRFVDYRELAIKPLETGYVTLPPVLLLGFVFLGLEILLRQTVLRRLP